MVNIKDWINYLRMHKAGNVAIALLIILAIICSGATYYAITEQTEQLGPNPSFIIKMVLMDLIVLLALSILVVRKVFKTLIYKNNDYAGGRLRNRIIIMFSLVAAIPTIIISLFSAYFFNFGLQSWFNQRVDNILTYSVTLSQAYSSDFSMQLKETTVAVADELSDMYYDLVHEPHIFNKILNAQASFRSLNEAMVFQNTTRSILAQTSMSFSLAFSTISSHLIARADAGEIVEIKSDPTRVRMLIKLREYNDTYLLVGKLIDPKLIDYSNKTSHAVKEYNNLNEHLLSLQVQFSMAFIAVAMLLLIIAISGGMIFAGHIIKPIRKLLVATEKLQHGDLSVQVSEEGPKDDELLILSRAFNKMVSQLNSQQKDLIIAQRALAWSDVARMVAHEIKNPLTPIQLASNMIKQKFEGEVTDKVSFNKYLQTILRHTSDIGTILTEFVNFAKMPSPKFQKVKLVKLLSEFIESRRLLNEKITYIFQTDLENFEFSADPVQLTQIMINLVKNAEEAMIDNPKEKKVLVSLHIKEEYVVLSVEDNGTGFPLEVLTKASELYFTTRAKGTGLGLAIVQKIVGDHNGTFSIRNIPEGGAKIELIFTPIFKSILT